jgi:DNA-binding helix-hairpin-helix protein with protein kinase domain
MVVADRRLAGGGQGDVFAVAQQPQLVFKRYKPTVLAGDSNLRSRLTTMITFPPPHWREPASGHVTLAWPTDIVLGDGLFAGFLMPAVDMHETVSLHRATNPSDRSQAKGPTSWLRGFSWRYLIRIGANLARVTQVVHEGNVVIGDFNESNVRVTREARVTLLDCDSMQIVNPRTRQRFFCPVGRPEFTPPELVMADWSKTVRHPSSDLFALAIHLYQLLLEGEHPFRGKWAGPGEKPPVTELARMGMWAHHCGGQLSPRPSAIPFSVLPPAIARLFRTAFEDGAVNPGSRPTAQQWHQALTRLEASLRHCQASPPHHYSSASPGCPWCRRKSSSRR